MQSSRLKNRSRDLSSHTDKIFSKSKKAGGRKLFRPFSPFVSGSDSVPGSDRVPGSDGRSEPLFSRLRRSISSRHLLTDFAWFFVLFYLVLIFVISVLSVFA